MGLGPPEGNGGTEACKAAMKLFLWKSLIHLKNVDMLKIDMKIIFFAPVTVGPLARTLP